MIQLGASPISTSSSALSNSSRVRLVLQTPAKPEPSSISELSLTSATSDICSWCTRWLGRGWGRPSSPPPSPAWRGRYRYIYCYSYRAAKATTIATHPNPLPHQKQPRLEVCDGALAPSAGSIIVAVAEAAVVTKGESAPSFSRRRARTAIHHDSWPTAAVTLTQKLRLCGASRTFSCA